MKWHVLDSTVQWLKVQSQTEKTYFMLWDQDPGFLAAELLAVIPADLSEGPQLKVQLRAGDLPGLDHEKTITSVIRDAELVDLWRTERRKLEAATELEPLEGKFEG